MVRIRTHRDQAAVTLNGVDCEAAYTYEPREAPERERGGSVVYPGRAESVEVEAVYLVDADLTKLRRALVGLLAHVGDTNGDGFRAAVEKAHQAVTETRGHCGPEVTDFLDEKELKRVEEQLLEVVHTGAEEDEVA